MEKTRIDGISATMPVRDISLWPPKIHVSPVQGESVDGFLRRGGKITYLKIGETGEPDIGKKNGGWRKENDRKLAIMRGEDTDE